MKGDVSQKRDKEARFIFFKSYRLNYTSFITNKEEGIFKNSYKTSFNLLLDHADKLNLDRNLITITNCDKGHFLIYDNREIIAYTVVRG